MKLGGDSLLNAEAEGESGTEQQTGEGRDDALKFCGLSILRRFVLLRVLSLLCIFSFLGEREGTLSEAHNGKACEGDQGVLHDQ